MIHIPTRGDTCIRIEYIPKLDRKRSPTHLRWSGFVLHFATLEERTPAHVTINFTPILKLTWERPHDVHERCSNHARVPRPPQPAPPRRMRAPDRSSPTPRPQVHVRRPTVRHGPSSRSNAARCVSRRIQSSCTLSTTRHASRDPTMRTCTQGGVQRAAARPFAARGHRPQLGRVHAASTEAAPQHLLRRVRR